MDKAYSLLDIKAVDKAQRIIEGIASTPTPDRGGDVMEPLGAEFTLPMPFLWQHNTREPIGEVFEATVRKDGIYIKAHLPQITPPGRVRDRVEEAWQSISSQPPLVRGLSIGFKPLVSEEIPKSKGLRILKWMWGELSAVVVPMNVEATILAVKSAASGQQPPLGVSSTFPIGRLIQPKQTMTIPEQITQFTNSRAAKSARQNELMTTAGEKGETLDAEQSQEYDSLALEVKAIDNHLVRLREQEKQNLVVATPIVTTTAPDVKASDLRGGTLPQIRVTSMAAKGSAFTRMCIALARGHGDSFRAMETAKYEIEQSKNWSNTPEVELMTKAAVAVGTTTDSTWAGPLVVTQPLVNEFLELLRPRTLIGRIPGLRQVPFNVSIPSQTTGGTYGWVGQNKPKPVTKADYATVSVSFAKAAGIIVLTEELVKLSTPSAENLVREEMIAGMGAFLDQQFNDPAIAAVTNVNPASITNGAATTAATGVTSAAAKLDLAGRVAVFTAANIPLDGAVWLMSDSNAFGISQSVNALGQPLFPGMGNPTTGNIFGIPVVVSNNVSTRVILLHAPSILIADDGGVRIDVSREASIQMDSAPTDTVDATTVYLSLWQRDLIGLRAERYITWLRARTAAVTYLTAAAYVGT